MGAFDGLEFKSGKEEMRLIEDEVVRALGCSHFERALEPYQFEVYEDCDSLSWLIWSLIYTISHTPTSQAANNTSLHLEQSVLW